MLSREAVVSLAPDPTGDSPGAILLARDLSGAVPIRGPRGSPADLSFAAGVLAGVRKPAGAMAGAMIHPCPSNSSDAQGPEGSLVHPQTRPNP